MPSGPVAWRSGLYCRALRRASHWLMSHLQATRETFAPWQLKGAVRTSKSESLAQKSGTKLRDKCLAGPPPSSPSPSLHAHNTQHRDSVNKGSHSVCNKSLQGIYHFVRVKGARKVNQIEDAFRCRATASGPQAHDRQLREHRYSTACMFTASSRPSSFLQACMFVVLTETETSTGNDHR
jgi:hypothetical protein